MSEDLYMPTYNAPVEYQNYDYSASGIDAVSNWLTGNKDTERQVAMMYEQQAYNSEQADRAFARQKYLRDTDVIAKVNQYRDLGLNPYTAMGMSGSSAPVSSSASVSSSSAPRMPNVLGYITSLISLGVQIGAKQALNAEQLASRENVATIHADAYQDRTDKWRKK